MEIKRTLLPPERLKPLFKNARTLPFGRNFTDYMFTMEHFGKGEWVNPEIKPYQSLTLDPAASVLHYSQEVFEGQKAYKAADGRILLFRPRKNAARMNLSLRRMCMPEIREELFIEAECEMVKLEKRWIPGEKGAALYIRPTAIATEPALGVRPSGQYLFYIILSPVGSYFQEGFKPISLWVCIDYSRAGAGGTGEAKTGGNYAASMLANQNAREKGFDQVLWLDARETGVCRRIERHEHLLHHPGQTGHARPERQHSPRHHPLVDIGNVGGSGDRSGRTKGIHPGNRRGDRFRGGE